MKRRIRFGSGGFMENAHWRLKPKKMSATAPSTNVDPQRDLDVRLVLADVVGFICTNPPPTGAPPAPPAPASHGWHNGSRNATAPRGGQRHEGDPAMQRRLGPPCDKITVTIATIAMTNATSSSIMGSYWKSYWNTYVSKKGWKVCWAWPRSLG